jgi:hypothetical protein
MEKIRSRGCFGFARAHWAVWPRTIQYLAVWLPASDAAEERFCFECLIHSRYARVKSSNHFIFLPRIPYNSKIYLSTWIWWSKKMILDLLMMKKSNNNKIW